MNGPGLTPELTPDSPETGPTLADFVEGFRRAAEAAEQAGEQLRTHYGPLFALTAGLAVAREAIERDVRRARQRENGREFRRTLARASSAGPA